MVDFAVGGDDGGEGVFDGFGVGDVTMVGCYFGDVFAVWVVFFELFDEGFGGGFGFVFCGIVSYYSFEL